MKKLIWMLLTVLMLFSACGAGQDQASSDSETEAEASVASELPPVADTSSGGEWKAGTSDGAVSVEPTGASESAPPLTFTLVIPEGYTMARIGMTLADKGICTVDEFLEAAQSGDFSEFPLIAEQVANPNRCFRLEGYLFPDTYDIYMTDTPDAIIRKILGHTEQKLNAELREEIRKSGYTVDEILVMASIIEKEAFGAEQMPKISSVLHNRLDDGMKIQCDVTISYVEGAIKPFITGDVNRYNSYYNTYKCPGLPAGAICNPGIAAIRAAVRPEETDYYFFVTDPDKNYYYAATWEEHQANVAVAMG